LLGVFNIYNDLNQLPLFVYKMKIRFGFQFFLSQHHDDRQNDDTWAKLPLMSEEDHHGEVEGSIEDAPSRTEGCRQIPRCAHVENRPCEQGRDKYVTWVTKRDAAGRREVALRQTDLSLGQQREGTRWEI